MSSDYRSALERAKKELAELESSRDRLQGQITEIESRIAKQKKGIEGLAHLADQETISELPIEAVNPLAQNSSFTDAVCYALKTVNSNLTPVQVRDRLRYLGYNLRKYKSDPLASIHTILKRLEGFGKVKAERNEIGRTAYRWITETDKLS